MKTRLFRHIFSLVIVIAFFVNGEIAMGQSFSAFTSGLQNESNQITSGQSQIALIGFKITGPASGSVTFTQFHITTNFTSNNYLANGTLYRFTGSTFNAASSTPVGNVDFNGNNITVKDLTETFSSSTTYNYVLVADNIYSSGSPDYNGQIYINTPNFATDANGGTNYSTYGNYRGYTFAAGNTPYAIRVTSASAGLNSIATTLVAGSTDVAMFGFSLSADNTYDISQIYINSNVTTLSQFFSSFSLYTTGTSDTYSIDARSAVTASITMDGGYAKITISGSNLQATTVKNYYWLVANVSSSITGTLPITPQFSFIDGQGKASFTSGTPYNTATVFGPTYAVNYVSINMASVTSGLDSSPIYGGQSQAGVFGFSMQAASGSATINQINIGSNNSSLSTYFANPALYVSTSSSFNPSNPGTPLANGTFNGSFINFTGFSTSVTASTPLYYYLVADVIYTGSGSTTFQFTSNQSSSALVQASPASNFNTFNITGTNYTISQPSFSVSNLTSGLINPTNIDYGQSGAVFGFSITPTGSTEIKQLNFKADDGTGHAITVENYFGGTAILYRAAPGVTSYNPSSPGTAVDTVTLNGSTVTVANLSEKIVSGQTYYYFLVVNNIYDSYTATATVRFYINQSNAIVILSGNSFSSTGTYGSGYTLNKRTVGYTFYDANAAANNITQGTLYSGQTGVVLYGFGISTTVSTTVNKFILDASYSGTNINPQVCFNHAPAVLYSSSSSVFSTSTASPVTGASFVFAANSDPALTISGFTQTLSSTPTYYFIVSDVNFSSNIINSTAGTMQFKLLASQTNPISQTSPSIANVTVPTDLPGHSFATSPTTLTVTGANTPTNGITQGDLTFGQSKIVLFGFKVETGGIYNLDQINMQATVSGGAKIASTFGNGTLYRSTDQYFAHAIAVPGDITFGTTIRVSNMTESLNSITGKGTYWYFLVADCPTTNTSFTSGTAKLQFTSGASNMFYQTTPKKIFNSITVSDGQTFTISNAYKWIGGASGHTTDFTWPANFKTQKNGTVSTAPGFTGSTISVSIGTVANYPVISTNTELGGLTFSSSAAQVTLNSGVTLTLHKGLNVNSASTANIVGPGKVVIDSGAVSGVASTGTIKLTSDAQIGNSGTFTLYSDENGSAAIDQLLGNSKITGSFNVERYILGGSTTYRGYRLLSSPTNISNSTTGIIDLGYLNNTNNTSLPAALTGGPGGTNKGFSVAIASPSIYLYREDVVPVSGGTNAGKNKGITAIYSSDTTSSVDVATGTNLATIANFHIPVGNGYIFYNIGSTAQPENAAAALAPASYAITARGYLNQGDITFKNWYTSASTLSYTSSLPSNKGFNMVGNPYACSLDLSTFYQDNSSVINPTIFVLNNVNPGQAYISYNASTGDVSDPHASPYVASGQGMFVQATSAGALTFKETQKLATTQLTGTHLLMGQPVMKAAKPGFFMKVEQDSVINDYCGIYFDGDSDDFDKNDAVDLDGASPKVYMSSYTADGKRTGINSFAGYKNGKTIKLYVSATANGLYKLKIEQIKNIDPIYDIWLKDNYKNDSLDLRSNDTYNFNIVRTDAASLGTSRFQVIIRKKSLPKYQFVSLTGSATSSGVSLTWKTQNEYNFTGFTVERLNANKEYDPLYYLQSDGSGSYTYIDKNPSLGINTYRIKQDDIDNNITYSAAVAVNTSTPNSQAGNITVYPSPAASLINVKFATPLSGSANVIVVNAMGDIVGKKVFTQQQDIMDVSKLKTGVYFIRCTDVTTQKEIGLQRFIKL